MRKQAYYPAYPSCQWKPATLTSHVIHIQEKTSPRRAGSLLGHVVGEGSLGIQIGEALDSAEGEQTSKSRAYVVEPVGCSAGLGGAATRASRLPPSRAKRAPF